MRAHALAICLFFISLAAPLYAQHPCDLPAPTSGTALPAAPLTVSTCQDGKDTNGNPAGITGWALYDNGARSAITLTAGTASPVSGLTFWSGPITAPPAASTHTYQIAGINAQAEGGKSSPFVLTVSLPPAAPTVPSKLTVK